MGFNMFQYTRMVYVCLCNDLDDLGVISTLGNFHLGLYTKSASQWFMPPPSAGFLELCEFCQCWRQWASQQKPPGLEARKRKLSKNPPACRRVWLEGVVLVSVLGLCLFLCSLAARFCFVWIKVPPDAYSDSSTPLLLPPSFPKYYIAGS